ncbi:hypothetical protein ACWD3J_45965 [Streptomyces sp. NPDC002755]|uniref:hypothetical protein n=1 Tax=Streptomyces sp. NPDC002884 TaxID=3154544 RepID=UPI00331DF64C
MDRWNGVFERDLALIPRRLERFHRTVQPSDLWQVLADLYTVDAAVRADAGTWAPTALLTRHSGVLPPHLIERRDVGDVTVCRITAPGVNHVVSFHGLYAALYPTARKPVRPVMRGNPKTRSTAGETFTLPGFAQRLVVPQPAIEAVRVALTGLKTSLQLLLSPSFSLAVSMNALSASSTDQPQADDSCAAAE